MKRKINTTNILFTVYILALIWVVMFKASFTFSDILALVKNVRINLIPFFRGGTFVLFKREILLNVIVFVPLGLFLRMLDVSAGKSVLYGFLTSLLFECCQLVTRMGTFDTTDLVTNTAGTAIGVLIYLLVRLIFKEKTTAHRAINVIASTAVIGFFALSLVLFLANR